MNYFMIEGNLQSMDQIEDALMKEHIMYSKKAMEEGRIVMSGLKADMSGGVFLMKAESRAFVEEYLANEPFRKKGIQEYKVLEFSPHYINKEAFDQESGERE